MNIGKDDFLLVVLLALSVDVLLTLRGLPRRGFGCSKDKGADFIVERVSLMLQGAASGSPADDTRRKGLRGGS